MFLFKSIILLLLMLQNAPTRVKLDAEIAQVYRQQKIVMQGSIYFNPENNNYSINTDRLKKGIYFVTVTFSDGKKQVKKLLKE